jgi:hypothetical protein
LLERKKIQKLIMMITVVSVVLSLVVSMSYASNFGSLKSLTTDYPSEVQPNSPDSDEIIENPDGDEPVGKPDAPEAMTVIAPPSSEVGPFGFV